MNNKKWIFFAGLCGAVSLADAALTQSQGGGGSLLSLQETVEVLDDQRKDLIAVSLILEGGTRQVYKDGDTALHAALRNKDVALASRLIDEGLDILAENHEEESPLSLFLLLVKEGVYHKSVHDLFNKIVQRLKDTSKTDWEIQLSKEFFQLVASYKAVVKRRDFCSSKRKGVKAHRCRLRRERLFAVLSKKVIGRKDFNSSKRNGQEKPARYA